MSTELVPNWITLIQHMVEWVYSNDIPNWGTLIVEIAIGIGIAYYIYRVQSKTDDLRDKVVNQIKQTTKEINSYTNDMRKLEDDRKNYYIRSIRKNLEYIEYQDREAIDIIIDFLQNDNNPDRGTWFKLNENRYYFPGRCRDILRWMGKLEDRISNPEPLERFIEFARVLDAPFVQLTDDREWAHSKFRLIGADNTLYVHVDEIEIFLKELSKM